MDPIRGSRKKTGKTVNKSKAVFEVFRVPALVSLIRSNTWQHEGCLSLEHRLGFGSLESTAKC